MHLVQGNPDRALGGRDSEIRLGQVDKLAEGGLVVRVPDPGDRRVTRVSTTPAGQALLADVRARKDVWLAARLAELDARERERLASALDVIDALTARERP